MTRLLYVWVSVLVVMTAQFDYSLAAPNFAYSRASALLRPSGLDFIGVGYNILNGNPDGGGLETGGTDPGINLGHKILQLTWDDKRTSRDGRFSIPDECDFAERSSTFATKTRSTFFGAKSYASKLSAQVDVSGSYSGVFAKVEFAASVGYQEVAKSTSTQGTVYFSEETVSNLGNARYQTSLAEAKKYPLGEGFVARVCSLPSNYHEQKGDYMTFINEWGTHVITEVALGTRTGKTFEAKRSSFVEYAAKEMSSSVSAGGSYGSFSASLSVDMSNFNSHMDSGTTFGSEFSSYVIGSPELNEPISLTLMMLNEALDDKFWLNRDVSALCSPSWDRTSIQGNVLTALKEYASWRNIQEAQDPDIIIPIAWPDGTYGLPKPETGCPNSHFRWNEGSRRHDTEDTDSMNRWSTPFDLAGSVLDRNNRRDEFCLKTVPEIGKNHWDWQPGSYCIYKKGDCPSGFDEGFLKWDDEDDDNKNDMTGTLPDGEYNWNTKIDFCCRSDAVADRPIFLPTDDEFVLFPQYEHCQKVSGMTATREFFRYDNEDTDNKDSQSVGHHPYLGKESASGNIVLYFCYYKPDN